MNIGEKFYCSRCLAELQDECVCKKCGYDSRAPSDESALEEGTLLDRMRFQVGAVRRKLKGGYVYGAFDYISQKPVYIFEYCPACGLRRDIESGSCVIVPKSHKSEFEEGMKKLSARLSPHHKVFSENNTLYVFRK